MGQNPDSLNHLEDRGSDPSNVTRYPPPRTESSAARKRAKVAMPERLARALGEPPQCRPDRFRLLDDDHVPGSRDRDQVGIGNGTTERLAIGRRDHPVVLPPYDD